VVVNTIPIYLQGDVTAAAVTDAVLADLERAAAAGADEMHVSLNLGNPLPPHQQVDVLGTLAAKLELEQLNR
jgi:hypothetical protein